MPAIFPLIRGALLGSVAIWTLIVLGIAIHFQMSFIPSPEMTFVPLAVFAAASTLVVFLLICVSSCIGRLKPIAQTRWELVWLGILAVLWLALGGLTSKTDTVEYEVECWTEEDGVVVDDDVDAYSNDVYHARYRVLQAFSLINALLLLGLFLFMLIFAIWHHKRGRWVIWTTPTNMVGWFDKPSSGDGLPAPVTGKQGRDHKYKQLLEKDDSKYTPIPAVTRKDTKNRYNNNDIEGKTQITGSNGYKIWVPAKNTSSDPEKVPIIAKKMLQERNAPPVATPQPVRRASERQAADLARQESRRDRAAREEAAGVELPRRQEIARKASGGHQPAVARPAGELRRGLSTPAAGTRPNAGRQGSTPAVVRPDARRQGSSQPQPTNNNAARPGVARQNTTQAPKRR